MRVMTVEAIADRVHGTVVGNAQRQINGAASMAKAGPDEIAFVAGEKQLRDLIGTPGACLLPRRVELGSERIASDTSWIFVDDSLDAFLTILREFRPQRPRPQIGLSPRAFISPDARIGPDCNIYPGAYIGPDVVIGRGCDLHSGVSIGDGCRIGDDCVLFPNVVLYTDVLVGNRVIIHASSVLGADGFGFRYRQGRFEKIPQLGWVEIGDDVEIGANSCVDRGMIGATLVGEGTKVDDLVMIGHNCEVGRHNALASQVGLAGSVTTGDFVRCAGQVGVADHVRLGHNTTYGAKCGVHRDTEDHGTYVGVPAMEEHEARKVVLSLPKVPELRRQVRNLETELEELKRQLADRAA